MPAMLLNWIIAFAVLALPFIALYFVIKMAVRDAMKESAHQLIEELAQKLWAEDKGSDQNPQV